MTGVNIIHIRQVPSTRKVIPTVIQRAVERETDRRSVPRVPPTPAIQTFLHVPTGLSLTADPEKAVKEVLASLQLMHTVIMPFLTVTHMAMIATASPITLTVMRLLLGLSTPVLQERCIITIAKQKNPSGKNQRSGLNEREEIKREKTRKNEIWLESRMEETLPSTENTWLLQNQANTYPLQRVLIEIIAVLISEIATMVTIPNLGLYQLIREKRCNKDSVKVTECVRWSKRAQCTPQLFPLLCIGLLLLQQMLEERQWFRLQEACKMFHHQPLHPHAPTCMTSPHTLPHQI